MIIIIKKGKKKKPTMFERQITETQDFDLHCCYHSRCLLKVTYKVESGCNCYTETILIF